MQQLVRTLNTIIKQYCYADTSYKDIGENYAVREICRHLQIMQVIT